MRQLAPPVACGTYDEFMNLKNLHVYFFEKLENNVKIDEVRIN